jgi:hypothetical protein
MRTVPHGRQPTQAQEHAATLGERNERARIERLQLDARRPPEELLSETLRLARFLTGLAEAAQHSGDVRP